MKTGHVRPELYFRYTWIHILFALEYFAGSFTKLHKKIPLESGLRFALVKCLTVDSSISALSSFDNLPNYKTE